MLLLPLLLACGGGPTAAVSTAPHPDGMVPATLAGSVERDFQRPIQRCYEQALAKDGSLQGQIRYAVVGSHGILKHELTAGSPGPLADCALEPMGDSRLMRTLGDGDNTVAFTVTVVFTP